MELDLHKMNRSEVLALAHDAWVEETDGPAPRPMRLDEELRMIEDELSPY